MAFFSRRRVQSMLDDLSEKFGRQKRADITARLNSKRADQSLPAEMELALLWMLKDQENFQIEPDWWPDSRKPDAYVADLIPGTPAVVEITTVADNSMTGEKEMDHCATALMDIANSEKRGVGKYLRFNFGEIRAREGRRSVRNIAAPNDYVPTEQAKRRIVDWLRSGESKSISLKIEELGLSVEIEHTDGKQVRYHNFHTSRPPRTYSETSNPIYQALNSKVVQVQSAPAGTWRIIFLAETGSQILSDLIEKDRMRFEDNVTARDIINRFVSDKIGRVDAVAIFVPVKKYRGANAPERFERRWAVVLFGESNTENQRLLGSLKVLVNRFPMPIWNGYNARSLKRQHALAHDSHGWYLPTTGTYKENKVEYKISSRAFQEFFSNKIDEKQFKYAIGEMEAGPSIRRYLEMGYTIRSIRLEGGGTDSDDDYIVLEFSRDAAASKFI